MTAFMGTMVQFIEQSPWWTAVILMLALFQAWMYFRPKRVRPNQLVYHNATGGGKWLTVPNLNLRGRPDLVRRNSDMDLVVEMWQPTKFPGNDDRPFRHHEVKITAQMRLVEEEFDQRPKYGLIRYADRSTHKVPYDDRHRDGLEDLIRHTQAWNTDDEIEATPHPNKCVRCMFRPVCEPGRELVEKSYVKEGDNWRRTV